MLRHTLPVLEQDSLFQPYWRPDDGGQRAIRNALHVAQTIHTLRHFTHGLEVNFESVEGYARTDRETREVMSNANGQCLYLTKEAAEQ